MKEKREMKKALRWLKLGLPFIRTAADEIADMDENETGTDDKIAHALAYAGDVIEAVAWNRPIPLPPRSMFTAEQLKQIAAK